MVRIAVIDYGAGNTFSVIHALRRAGAQPVLVKTPRDISSMDGMVLPGVGHARSAWMILQQTGWIPVLQNPPVPLLGICLGLQLLFEETEEGNFHCLGIFPGKIRSFRAVLPETWRIPHMGWNTIDLLLPEDPLFQNIPSGTHFYFAHSYWAPVVEETLARTTYGISFSSAVRKEHLWAVQFHPEKSGEVGMQIWKNFIDICR